MKRQNVCHRALILCLLVITAGCSGFQPPLATPVFSASVGTSVATAMTSKTAVVPSPAQSPTGTHTLPAVTATPTLAAAPATPTPTLLETVEEKNTLIYCKQDGCIYNAHQVLSRPIPEPFNQAVDTAYRYGTTQGGLREVHRGVEFVNPTGTPVIAAADGIVEFAGDDLSKRQGGLLGFYGNLVILRHDIPGWEVPVFTLYAHLSYVSVETGEKVSRGQVIGAVGKSGSASGSHLHFEVRVGANTKVASNNPELWLEPAESSIENTKNGTLILRLFHRQGSVFSLAIVMQDYTDPHSSRHRSSYAESYAVKAYRDPFWMENLVVGDIVPGIYRVFFTRHDRTYQKYVEIEPGRITLVEFDIDY